MLFTPIDNKTGKRLKMDIEEMEIPRKVIREFIVTEKFTGKRFLCRTRSCSIPTCICDAYLFEELTT